jgi:hypothetical protein
MFLEGCVNQVVASSVSEVMGQSFESSLLPVSSNFNENLICVCVCVYVCDRTTDICSGNKT